VSLFIIAPGLTQGIGELGTDIEWYFSRRRNFQNCGIISILGTEKFDFV